MSGPPKSATTSSDLAAGIGLFFATLIAYLPALHGELIWDDAGHVTSQELQSLHGLWRIWFELGATQQYYPLLHSAFWMEHRLWGDAVWAYHLTNIAEHALAAYLVVLIVRRLGLPGAWLAGLIFALHPVCVEAVAWITEQKSTLSAVFYLASALCYLQFDRTRRTSQYLIALGLFLCALLSKTVTATLPAALLVLLWWKRGRLDPKRDILPLAPWLALGATAGLFTAWVERTYIGAEGADFGLTFLERILLAGRVIWFYLGKLLWPSNLIFIYPRWTIDPSAWWQYLFPAGVIALAAALVLIARRRRGPLAAFLFFAGTLFPVLGFFNVYPFLFSYVADHFQYLATPGVIVPAAYAISVAAKPRVSAIAGGALVAVLAILTFHQSIMYMDAESLYKATLASNPESWMAHNNLGIVYSKIPGRTGEAIAEYEATLRIKPDYPEAHYNLANLLVSTNPDEAIAHYQAALRVKPKFVGAHTNLGITLSMVPGRLEDAIAEYETALRLQPHVAQTHFDLGNALVKMPGRLPEAMEHYRAAIKYQPNFAEAHFNLALALSQGPVHHAEAIQECEAALRIKPDFEAARRLLEQLKLGAHQAAGEGSKSMATRNSSTRTTRPVPQD